jgi:hypothetical protein
MSAKYNPVDIKKVLTEELYPTLVMWNRLEARPRTQNFDKALKAEVRDALWMLTKQWQMGEFKGDDAGTPVFSKVHITSSHLQKYKPAGKTEETYEDNVPLEAKTEQKLIPFIRADKEISIDIRLQMGRYWLKILKNSSLAFEVDYTKEFKFLMAPSSKDTDYIYAHRETWQYYSSISGRCMDGYKFYEYITKPGQSASDIIPAATTNEKNSVDTLASDFIGWYEKFYYQPLITKDEAWLPQQLEYQFEASATGGQELKTLKAEQYYQGHLDWPAFDIVTGRVTASGPDKNKFSDTFIPSHVQFEGMPDTRWWKFEDSKTSLGDIKPSTTDLSKLLFMEFGLIFANDWFMIPFRLPIGSLANVEGLTVKNNFGETIWIKPSEAENTADLPWSMYKMRSSVQNNTLFLAPAAIKVHESNPLEEVLLIRDEMANMVWAIETVVPLPMGIGDKGGEVALRIRKFHEKLIQGISVPADLPYAAPISYLSMTDVPENWIPFVPVHIEGDNRETQLQRASMLRIIDGDPVDPAKIKPQTSILREGLEAKPDALPYYVHEEEVTRAGIRIVQSFQRTRWINGEVFVWLGMKKKTGRGEGSSGLAFDQIKDVK